MTVMIRGIIYEFIDKMDKLGITPNDSHIEVYLSGINRYIFKDELIKFCFYHWERRHDEKHIENLLNNI